MKELIENITGISLVLIVVWAVATATVVPEPSEYGAFSDYGVIRQ